MPVLLSLMVMTATMAYGKGMPNVPIFRRMGYYDGAVFIERFCFCYVAADLFCFINVAIGPMGP